MLIQLENSAEYPTLRYLHGNFYFVQQYADIIQQIEQNNNDTFVFLCTGTSGVALTSMLVAILMERKAMKNIVRVFEKKKLDKNGKEVFFAHNGSYKDTDYATYIRDTHNVEYIKLFIVDDFVCTGDTLVNLHDYAKNLFPDVPISGVLTYKNNCVWLANTLIPITEFKNLAECSFTQIWFNELLGLDKSQDLPFVQKETNTSSIDGNEAFSYIIDREVEAN